MLEHANVRGAVPGNRDVGIHGGQFAGHGLGPQQLIIQLAVNEAVGHVQMLEQGLEAGTDRGDQLDQRFGIIGGDGRMGQRRAQCQRVWRGR